MKHPLEINLNDLYEYMLLDPLSKIYSAKKQTQTTWVKECSNLIIDKFAIHSSSFYHLSRGIVERKKSGEIRMAGYDLFTVNSTFRAMMESYATFNNLFVESKSDDEEEFRVLLWKLDGLFDKKKFEIGEDDFPEARGLLERDRSVLAETIKQFEACKFYRHIKTSELEKLYKPDKAKIIWRFLINDDFEVTPLKITDLIKHSCKTKAFINNYRYTSTHAHTNYLAIEHFKQTRGVPISEDYVNPLTKLAIYLTCLMITDICKIDSNASIEYQKLPDEIKNYVTGMSNAIKNS